MKLVAILIWWDESPSWLATVVASAAKAGCTHIVAVDGPYALLTMTENSSGSLQHDAIVRAAEVAGIGLTLYVPPMPFIGNEVEKRSLAFKLAEAITTEDDWYFILDADTPIVSARYLLSDLAQIAENSVEISVILRDDATRTGSALQKFPMRLIHRAMRGLEVHGTHYNYRYPTPAGWRFVWGAHVKLDPAAQLHDVAVEHWSEQRAPLRKAAQQVYYDRRDEAGIESVHETYVEGLDGQPLKLKR